MKALKAKDLRQLTQVELEEKYHRLKEDLFKIKLQLKMQQKVENPVRMRTLKRDLAKILTVLTERRQNKTGVKV